jgi:hypothetical protein
MFGDVGSAAGQQPPGSRRTDISSCIIGHWLLAIGYWLFAKRWLLAMRFARYWLG